MIPTMSPEQDTGSAWYESRMRELANPPAVPGETIVAAAIKISDVICSVPRPGRHGDVFYALHRAGLTARLGPEAQGFVTSAGRFVGREEARTIAETQGQLIARAIDHDHLFSEDVW